MAVPLPVREVTVLDDGGLAARVRAGREESLARAEDGPGYGCVTPDRACGEADAATWPRVAEALEAGDPDFAGEVWRRIALESRLDVRWPIFAALHVRLGWGRDTSAALAGLLGELGLAPAASLILEDLVRRSSLRREVREWAALVLSRLGPS